MHRIRRPSFVTRALVKVFKPGKHRIGEQTLSVIELFIREGATGLLAQIAA